jgi:hypothetical protein
VSAADAQRGGGVGGAVCEVCAPPLAAGSRPLRVGACEFAFHVHDECRQHLGPLAEEIAAMCVAAEVQPEGLLWLGSWEPLRVPEESEGDR